MYTQLNCFMVLYLFSAFFFQAAVQNLVTKVTTVLDNLIVTPDAAELVRIYLI